MGRRATRKRLMGKIRERIALDPELDAEHGRKRWTRRWFYLGRAGLTFLVLFGGFFIFLAIACLGLMMNGLVDVGRWVGDGKNFRPPIAPVLAGWCLLSVAGTIGAALSIRQHPISVRFRPWGTSLPIPDCRLIRPVGGILAKIASAAVVLAIGAFVFPAFMLDWSAWMVGRVALMVLATILTSWLLADWLAAYLPPTPMIQAVAVVLLIVSCVVPIGFAVTTRDVLEVRQLQSYEALWVLPPAGWYVGLAGLWPGNWLREYLFPTIGLAITFLAWRRLARSLELEDVQLITGQYQPAFRRGWLRSWARPNKDGEMAEAADRPERLRELVAEHREVLLGSHQRSLLDRILCPFRLTGRQLAVLGLLGIRFPRRSRWQELIVGFWPLPFCIAMLALNQFYPLRGLPPFLRVPLIMVFALSLANFREFSAAYAKGNLAMGFAASRSIFPYSIREIFTSLLANRLLFAYGVLPGWAVSIGILLMTDIPLEVIWGTPVILMCVNLLAPLYCTIVFVSSNLRSCWQTWVLVLTPWSLLTMAAWIVLQFSVAGNMLAQRVDLAFVYLGVVAVLVCSGAVLFLWTVRKLRSDETTTAISQTLRRF
ncbi:MAG: hypothetical protein VXZ82_13045 [Planctomycetota bacterium]|nr:hypothetical protein [Planctomycetota bacterium]